MAKNSNPLLLHYQKEHAEYVTMNQPNAAPRATPTMQVPLPLHQRVT